MRYWVILLLAGFVLFLSGCPEPIEEVPKPDRHEFGPGIEYGIGVDTWTDTATNTVWVAFSRTLPGLPGDVRIFRQTPDGGWVLEDTITRPGRDEDYFGAALALEGNTLAVGVPFRNTGATKSGEVYVYRRTDGAWTFQARLRAPVARPVAKFGYSLGLSGDWLFVGAPGEQLFGPGVGWVYVYHREDGSWQSKSLNEDPPAKDDFDGIGWSVALEGDRAVIGAPHESSGDRDDPANNSAPSAGAAYVYRLQDGKWLFDGYLKELDPVRATAFGWSVDIQGGRIVVGAPWRTIAGKESSGAVSIFRNVNGSWGVTQEIPNPTGKEWELFGFSVAVYGDTLVATSPLADEPRGSGVLSGTSRVYRLRNGSRDQKFFLWNHPPQSYLQYGGYLWQFKKGDNAAIHEKTFIIGAPGRGDQVVGNVFVYQ